MLPILLFGALLILSFGVLYFFLRPTRTETAVQHQLESIVGNRAAQADSITILRVEKLSTIPWLNELMRYVPGSAAASHLIKQAGVKWQVSSLVCSSLLMAVVAGSLASFWISSAVLSACVGVAVGLSPFGYLYFLREKRFRACEALLPDAVDLMARALRAGHAVTSGLEMVSREVADPLGSEFRILHEEQSLGLPLREAMLNLVERVPREDMRFLATAILLQRETGGNLAQILDKTGTVMRERLRLRGQVRIYTAQARVTGWIMGSMPFILFVVMSLINPDYEKVLFTDPTGKLLIYGGLTLMAIGILVIRKIINVKV